MKVIYLNKETGKEVHYGENITFKESGKFANGYSYQSETTLPIINETIPDLIKRGVLVQKEVEENSEIQNELTIDKKLDVLGKAVKTILEKIQKLEECIIYGDI